MSLQNVSRCLQCFDFCEVATVLKVCSAFEVYFVDLQNTGYFQLITSNTFPNTNLPLFLFFSEFSFQRTEVELFLYFYLSLCIHSDRTDQEHTDQKLKTKNKKLKN